MKNENEVKPIKIEFLRINFDKILTDHQKDYCSLHPEVGTHQALDIVFGQAHQAYLDQIKYHCLPKSAMNENAKSQQNFMVKQMIYLDRNNSSDCWPEISKAIEDGTGKQATKTFKSILILPEQHPDFNPSLYNHLNHICP